MSTNTGGPAFPVPVDGATDGRTHDAGMTLLDWFAGQALAGLISKLPVIDQTEQFGIKVADKIAYNSDVACSCYALADAMLAEKARREGVVKESFTTDDAGLAKLEEVNRELAEALASKPAPSFPKRK